MKIQDAEYEARCGALVEHLLARGLTGVVLFENAYVLYYTGFAFMPTERPTALVVNAAGKRGMLVPRLEREHAQANATVDHVADYPEYPSEPHPMESLRACSTRWECTSRSAPTTTAIPGSSGYRGPSLTELTGTTPERSPAFVEDQMAVKSPAEIELIRESSKWGNLAHVLLQRYTRPGLTETEVTPAREHGGVAGDARRDRPALPRAELLLRRGRAPAIADRSAATRPSRTRWRTTSSSRRATCS